MSCPTIFSGHVGVSLLLSQSQCSLESSKACMLFCDLMACSNKGMADKKKLVSEGFAVSSQGNIFAFYGLILAARFTEVVWSIFSP